MELIAIGRISKPIGTRGEIKILPLTDDPKRFAVLQSVWVGHQESAAKQLDVIAVRIETRQIAVRLSGVENADAAEQIRDQYLFVPKEEVIKLRSGSYFMHDVIGCEVLTQDNVKVGTVSDLFSLPSNDVWLVRNGEKEILIPAVKEIIKQVDIEKKRITIHAVEGLLD
jgi:16S rRNA processing protein RimM